MAKAPVRHNPQVTIRSRAAHTGGPPPRCPAGRRCPGGPPRPTTCGLCLRRRRGDGDGPDEEVRAAVADVFAAFAATGSAYGVAGAFAERRFPKRALWRAVGRRAALGAPHLPRPRHADQPRICRSVRVRPVPFPAGGCLTGPSTTARSSYRGQSGPPSSPGTTPATSLGRTTWPPKLAFSPTRPAPGPGRPERAAPFARASFIAAAVGGP